VADADNCHDTRVLVNPIDHSVGPAASTVPVIKRWEQPLTDSVRLFEQRTGDELKRGDSRRLRQDLGKVALDLTQRQGRHSQKFDQKSRAASNGGGPAVEVSATWPQAQQTTPLITKSWASTKIPLAHPFTKPMIRGPRLSAEGL